MKLLSNLSAAAMLLLLAYPAISATKDADERAAHHPASAPVSAVASSTPAGYEQQMKMMQEMHQKMGAAKTAEERAALMKDHMKSMQDGMAMMGQMRGGMMAAGRSGQIGKSGMPTDADMMMKRRMDMMEMMMQMMMDREGMKPPMLK
ncbi:hypothetical protein [Roseateles sp.]|uniref:hypothetical protein n=1 Tax=Roseateles sp. TaxID=1971397 RepID=UPI00286AAC1B|nr:hypothetical protein [Roseateles sp.]